MLLCFYCVSTLLLFACYCVAVLLAIVWSQCIYYILILLTISPIILLTTSPIILPAIEPTILPPIQSPILIDIRDAVFVDLMPVILPLMSRPTSDDSQPACNRQCSSEALHISAYDIIQTPSVPY